MRPFLLAGLATSLLAASSVAATTIDSVRARGSLQCGGVPRLGLADLDAKARWSGFEIEICRALATAVLGDKARFDFHGYESVKDFDRIRTGDDDVSFVTPNEMAGQRLGNALRAGPTIFVERQALLVAAGSPFERPTDLAGHAICFIIATASDDALENWASAHKIDFVPNAFQEPDEMADAFDVQKCQAIAGESTQLAAIRRDGGIDHLRSRILSEPLATMPILAAVPSGGDTTWSDVVASNIGALRNARPAASLDGDTLR